MSSVTELTRGAYRIRLAPLKSEVDHVYCYLMQKSDGAYLLIDTGMQSSGFELMQLISERWGRQAPVDQILLTHLHPDHYGGANSIRKSYSSGLMYHPGELVHLDMFRRIRDDGESGWGKPFGLPDALAGQIEELFAVFANLPAADSYVDDGQAIRTTSGDWTAIHTPGHSPGHLCLYNSDEGILLSGDHLLPNETSNVPFHPVPSYGSLEAYLKSLLKVRLLQPRQVWPSHGDAFTDVKGRIDEILNHHRRRLMELLDGLELGRRSVPELARCVNWARGAFEDLKLLDKWLAILETISHLEFLCDSGVILRRMHPRLSYALVRNDWKLVEDRFDRLTF